MIPKFLHRLFWPHRQRTGLLQPEQLEHLRQSVLQSPYLAPSDLNEGFTGSYGFSIFFQSSERQRAEKALPGLAPFLDQVVRANTNVMFLNPLVIGEGKLVHPHVDKTLHSFLDWPLHRVPYPVSVSVLYLQLAENIEGGDLKFHRWFGALAVTPEPNALVEFPGWMVHEVTPWQGDGTTSRVSLVLEQYELSPAALAEVPEYALFSERTFEDFLREADEDIEDPDEDQQPDSDLSITTGHPTASQTSDEEPQTDP